MLLLAALLLLGSPESEHLLLGPSPFFREEGMRRAVREGDRDLLERAAASGPWDARRLAALGLGADAPLALLDDPVPVVREAALRALDTAVPPDKARTLLEDPDDAVRAAAAWALRGSRLRGPLRARYDDPAPSVRWTAMAAAGDFSRLRRLAERGKFAERIGAWQMLGRAGGASEASYLLGRLGPALRDAARESEPLYLRDRPRSDVALARAVGDLARRDVRALGKPVAEHLAKLIERSDLEGNAPLLLAEAVAGTRDAQAAERILAEHLTGRARSTLPDPWLAPALGGILHAFAREGWPGLAPLVAPLLEHDDARVRRAAVGVLAGDGAAVALRDPDPVVRARAAARLESADALARALDDRHPEVRAAAVAAAGRRGCVALAGALREQLVAPDAGVRLAVVGALLRLDVPDRTKLLVTTALLDPAPDVRASAGAVLGLLDDPHAIRTAVAALGDPVPAVRRHAIELLHRLVSARHGYDPEHPAEGRARWQAWLARKQERPPPPDAFRYAVEDLRRRGVDLVLVMDATGSMAPVVQATKRHVAGVMERLRRVVPDLRARVVAYRDAGDAFLTLSTPLTHDARLLEDFLACLPANGGGDAPEAVLDGLRRAMEKTRWREGSVRLVLLFGDAPPHDRDRVLLDALVGEFDGTLHAVDASGAALGAPAPGTAQAFAALARRGGGVAVRLGGGGSDELLREILVLVLGPRHRAAIESLFGL